MRQIFRSAIAASIMLLAPQLTLGNTPIMGDAEIQAEQMAQFVRQVNPDFPTEIAEAFINVGRRYGVRGDIALCQSILETGWFRFSGGTAVTFEQNNYCGLGVTKLGVKGLCFDTIEQGVTAQIQHLFAYASKHALPSGEEIVDPRFKMVTRGSAPSWEHLSGRWAANDHYGRDILAIYNKLASFIGLPMPPAEGESTATLDESRGIMPAFFDE